jgi:hypothetical protein
LLTAGSPSTSKPTMHYAKNLKIDMYEYCPYIDLHYNEFIRLNVTTLTFTASFGLIFIHHYQSIY